ncbi:hypothetical protein [Acinetobacter sp. YH01020]|uniref:hypothetical protein n=1 Tax=Acinetobacter sp. YH01020 TaxID=2601034 RepID=UPI0015D13585|nr:hypothetical protein [Acinetobacter sp. YH01020]
MRSPDQIGISWEENQLLMQQLREKAALENRRQYNIFEVGDFIFHPMFSALFEIKRFAEKYVVASTKWGYEEKLLIELISHATDEEIKAGKRLEVKSEN